MVYLNNAATTYPKPDCVPEALDACVRTPPASQFRNSADFGKSDVFGECRKNLGRLLGIAETDRIFFTSGATEAANAVIGGLPLGGRRVLTTQTEHNSILRPLMNLPGFAGTERTVVASCGKSGRMELSTLENAVTADTGALIVNHCSNVTGMVQDMRLLSRFAKKHGLLFIADVSQSAGCLPVDADEWGLDALIFTGHKSLFGVQGTGGFYIRSGVELRPLKYGGTGRNSARLTYPEKDYEYEPGTQNGPGVAALNAGVRYVLGTGLRRIMQRESELLAKLYRGLERLGPVTVYGSHEENKGPVVSFNVGGLTPSDVAYILYGEYGIVVRAGLHCSPLIHQSLGTEKRGTVRVSVSCLTTDGDIDAFLQAMKEIAGTVNRSL